jgi:hypothetical protein
MYSSSYSPRDDRRTIENGLKRLTFDESNHSAFRSSSSSRASLADDWSASAPWQLVFDGERERNPPSSTSTTSFLHGGGEDKIIQQRRNDRDSFSNRRQQTHLAHTSFHVPAAAADDLSFLPAAKERLSIAASIGSAAAPSSSSSSSHHSLLLHHHPHHHNSPFPVLGPQAANTAFLPSTPHFSSFSPAEHFSLLV